MFLLFCFFATLLPADRGTCHGPTPRITIATSLLRGLDMAGVVIWIVQADAAQARDEFLDKAPDVDR
jgi:hypothetical protein